MAKIRIHEIAKELGYDSKEIIEKANELGLGIKTASNAVEPEIAAAIYEYIQTREIPEAFKKNIKTPTAKKPKKENIKEQFIVLRKELEKFPNELFGRKFGIMISKSDSVRLGEEFAEQIALNINELDNYLKEINNPQSFLIKVSSLEKTGLKELKFMLLEEIKTLRNNK